MSQSQKKRKIQKFTEEFRVGAAAQVINEGRNIQEVASGLGVTRGTLGVWVAKFRSGTWAFDLGTRGKQNKAMKQPSQDQIKISELQVQVRRLTQERDILKKAAAYFAQNLE